MAFPSRVSKICLVLCVTAVLRTLGQSEEGSCVEGDVRLRDGSSERNGRVEICYQNSWGTICDDLWDDNDAAVVCRQLNFSAVGARSITGVSVNFTLTTGPIHLDNVQCVGTEAYLVNCSSQGFLNHDCNHIEDAGVGCEPAGFSCETGAARLMGGATQYEGYVEVCINNKYTTVCDDLKWDINEATVVCRQLGFTEGGTPVPISAAGFGIGIGSVLNMSGLLCTGEEPNLYQCTRRTDIFSSLCSHRNDAGVLCPQPNATCEDGAIRLVGALTPNEGRVEICYNSHWGTVCHSGWGFSDAQVVCRQLGYTSEGAIPVGYADFGAGTGLVFLNDVECRGDELTLPSCQQDPVGLNYCSHFTDAGVICQDPNVTCTNGSMRLVDGESPNEGRLEVCFLNHWGTVCDDEFDSVDAALVCQHLGYSSEGSISLNAAYFGQGVGLIFLDDVECVGNETSIFDCLHLGIGISNCFHSEDVSILCQAENSTCTNGDVRLVNGTPPYSGRVEVCFNGRWGTVCDDNWGADDAAVVCNQLGFTGDAVGLSGAYFGEGEGLIFLDDADCSASNHSNLAECFDVETDVGTHNCAHSEDAGVICQFGERSCGNVTNGGVRLVGGASPLEGRVEVCLDGEWGTVCDDFWSNLDAVVVCNQLSLGRTDALAIQGAEFGPGTGPIHLSHFFCSGAEPILTDCPHKGIQGTACTHNQDASVVCSGITCSDGELRLVDGRFPGEGRVEICFEDHFGTVCDDFWDRNDAVVVCRELGFNDGEGAFALPRAFFGVGTRSIFLDDVGCIGNETSLLDCPHERDPTFCFHSEDASVVCQSANASQICTNGDMRLMGGGAPYQGTIELCYNGHWGTVCQDSWDALDALVVCTNLGFGDSGLAIPTISNHFQLESEGPVLLDEVQCNGTEGGLLQCQARAPGEHNCFHGLDAGVFCSVFNESFACQTGDVRLVDGSTEMEGRVEMCINGQWGIVCDSGWGNREAAVVCRQLGYNPNNSIAVLRNGFGQGSLPVFLSSTNCGGDEDVLTQCEATGPGAFCQYDAGVICSEVECVDGDVRLVEGEVPSEGTVEVCLGGVWAGTICHDGWDRLDAQVVCGQLGFDTENAIALLGAFFGPGSGDVLLEDVDCIGTELSLAQCDSDPDPNCSHNSDAGVICQTNTTGNCTAGDVRLADGSTEYEGRVEVCLHGRWGTVCDDEWGGADARVVCNQLGYMETNTTGLAYPVGNSHFGAGDGFIALDEISCAGTEEDLLACEASPLGTHNCDSSEDAGVFCPAPGQACRSGEVRLADGVREGEGRVEICLGGTWSAHCAFTGWDNRDAQVVCRQLGFDNPQISVSITATVAGSGPILSVPLNCRGDEANLADCPLNSLAVGFLEQFFCSIHLFDAGVICIEQLDNCTDGDIRLEGGSAENEGRVEVCNEGLWGSICDDSWDNREAGVVCRQLGYPEDQEHLAVHSAFFGAAAAPIHLSELSCEGTEERLVECSRPPFGEHNCQHDEDAGVVCTIANSTCANGELRLVNGDTEYEGRLEMCFGGRWGTVCDDLWDDDDASVACAQLGFSREGASATSSFFFGFGTGLILLDSLECNGTELRLLDCAADEPGLHNCVHSEDAGLVCQPSCEDGTVRLQNSSLNVEGTVEVCLDNTWGTICDEGWGPEDAAVVCNLLGYPSEGAIAVKTGYLSSTSDTSVLVSGLNCAGTEDDLLACGFTQQPFECPRGRDSAGVVCVTGDETEGCGVTGEVRLAGSEQAQGGVQVCLEGDWVTVCDLGWDDVDATVVCNQLGFTHEGLDFALRDNFRSFSIFPLVIGGLDCDSSETNILSCANGGRDVCRSARSSTDMAVICSRPNASCDNGAIRLVGGESPSVGRVEVCLGSQWTPVCAQVSWSNAEARVTCRQLGYQDVQNATAITVNGGTGPLYLTSLVCTGDEDSLLDCARQIIGGCSSTAEQAGVVCAPFSNCSDGEIRLVGGRLANEGRVEVCFRGVWGAVCDDGWSTPDVNVVCRQLGYAEGIDSIPLNSEVFGYGQTAIHLDDVGCVGNESRLVDCSHFGIGQHNCAQDEHAGVICAVSNSTVCNHGDLRLVDGLLENSGRVEICVGEQWGSICDDGYDVTDAMVICRQLGYRASGATPLNSTLFTAMAFGHIMLEDLGCAGTEERLLDCPRRLTGFHNCRHNEDIGVLCVERGLCEDGDIRLIGSTAPNEGTIQLCLDNAWGTVCDDNWSNEEAMVACGKLGYQTTGAVALRGAFFGEGEGSILGSDFFCSGTEASLLACPYSRSFFCSHFEDAGVICPPNEPGNCTNGDIRLVDGQTQYEGRVEVCLHGRWGAVCDDEWGGADARVVCRQLNYTQNGSPYAISNAPFGVGEGPFFVDNVACVGNETSFLSCRANDIGDHDCSRSEAAGVLCPYVGSACANGDVRLTGGDDEHSGRLELCLAGVWGSLCANTRWNDRGAQVVCRQLGYNDTSAAIAQSSISELYGEGSGPILASSPSCTGQERVLSDCSDFNNGFLRFCDHSDDAGVICRDTNAEQCGEGTVRLVGGAADNEGRVEVCSSGMYGTVCDDSWDGNEAGVVCRQLGYTRGGIPVPRGFFGVGSNRMHLDDLQCNGTETSLLSCAHAGLGNHDCAHVEDAGVICIIDSPECDNGEVRLENGATEREGRVEICFGGRWGTVCDDDWDDVDASVVCRQLGHSPIGAQAFGNARFGQGTLHPIFLDETRCTGNESRLSECPSSGRGNHNCFNFEDAGVSCRPLPCDANTYRLVSGLEQTGAMTGVLEVCVEKLWEPVCADDFTSSDAQGACLSFNMEPSLAIVAPGDVFPPPKEMSDDFYSASRTCSEGVCNITTSSVSCNTGSVGIFCPIAASSTAPGGATCETGHVRLVGGATPNEGRVEVCLGDQWGTVCDDSWDSNSATVVCRQLGLPTEAAEYLDGSETAAAFGSGSGKIWLDDVKCSGDENNILSCPQTSFTRKHNCKNTEDTGVRCPARVVVSTTDKVVPVAPSKDGQTADAAGGIVIPLVVIIVVLVIIVLVIIVVIVVVIVIRARRGGSGQLQFKNEQDDENPIIESDFLGNENSMELEKAADIEKEDLGTSNT